MIQQFQFTGEGRQIDTQGTFFRYEAGTDGSNITEVKLTIDGNSVGTFVPGDAFELPSTAKRWEIVPLSSGCTGVVKIGHGRLTSTKLSGVVQTIDGGRARSQAGMAFAGYGYYGALASFSSYVQIWNKPASKKNVIVNMVGASTSGQLNIQVAPVTQAAGSVWGAGQSKKAGGGSSSAVEIRVGATTSLPAAAQIMRSWVSATAVPIEWRMSEPILLSPGRGLTLSCYPQNQDLAASFEWYEEDA